jgi:hypothetical protein
MFRDNHRRITQDALAGSGLQPGALEFVVRSNMDSDDDSNGLCGAGFMPQHFQNVGDNRQSFRFAMDFIQNALNVGARYIVRDGSPYFGLYFFGRATHCVQDFYAHSNWIFIKRPPMVLHGGQMPPNLYLCYETTGKGMWQKIQRNAPPIPILGTKNKIPGTQYVFDLTNPADRSQWLFLIKSRAVYHQNIHLDIPSSWASQCYRMLCGQGRNGYYTAEALATEHTRIVWRRFLDGIGASARNDLLHYKVDGVERRHMLTPSTNINWQYLRSKFDKEGMV